MLCYTHTCTHTCTHTMSTKTARHVTSIRIKWGFATFASSCSSCFPSPIYIRKNPRPSFPIATLLALSWNQPLVTLWIQRLSHCFSGTDLSTFSWLGPDLHTSDHTSRSLPECHIYLHCSPRSRPHCSDQKQAKYCGWSSFFSQPRGMSVLEST